MAVADGTNPTCEMLLGAALEYAGYGWRVLPLRDGKIPRVKEWQHVASIDETVISGWWEQWPESNVGVKLGPDSGIIDVECDSADEEQIYLRLFDGNPPVTPTFQSSRGKHRLFKWRDNLPEPAKNTFKIGKLTWRTGNGDKGAQSVFPPSLHTSGVRYVWLVHPSDCEPATIPEAVFVRLHNAGGENLWDKPAGAKEARGAAEWERIASGVSEGSRNEDAAAFIGKLLHDLKNPFDANSVGRTWILVQAWNDRNRPPLKEGELKATFHSILQRDRNQRANSGEAEKLASQRPFDADETIVPEWKLVIVDSRPPMFRLYSPLWSLKTADGYILLNGSQMRSPRAIGDAAIDQAKTWVDGSFDKMWKGTKDSPSLAKQLIDSADHLPAPLESKRDLVIAELLYEALARADSRVIEAGAEPDSNGRPCTLDDDSIVFKFRYVWEPMARSDVKVKQDELTAILEKVGAKDNVFGNRGSRRRYKVLSRSAIIGLRHMIGISEQT